MFSSLNTVLAAADDMIIDLPPVNGVPDSVTVPPLTGNLTPGLDRLGDQVPIRTGAPLPGGTPNNNSPVITPNQQPLGMLDQDGPNVSEDCGISPTKGKWNYCLLAPLNGLIGKPGTKKNTSSSGSTAVEIFDVSGGLSPFFFKVYRIGVMAAIALSIVMISLGGIQLATTDSISGTDSGRKKINAAFAGLFIALFSYVLLYTINPALVNNGSGDIFDKQEIKP
jgi:hypothetical protein